jgi:putative ABC transport system permease protein
MASLPLPLQSIGVGFDALRVNPLRTFLATLGVIIGVAALVAVLSLGDGMQKAARAQLAQTTDIQTVVVRPLRSESVDGQLFPIRDPARFTVDDATALGALDGADGWGIVTTGRAEVRLGSPELRRMATVMARLGAGTLATSDSIVAGRALTLDEQRGASRDVVVSAELAREIAGDRAAAGNSPAAVGRTLRIEGDSARVVGVLAPRPPAVGETGDYRVSGSMGFVAAVLPAEQRAVPTVYVRAARVEDTELLRARIESWIAARDSLEARRTSVVTNSRRLEQARTGILTFKLFMGAITGISLLVGGIGIMNVLLASVTERTREIGIRKAAGARARDIHLQFLAESVAISGVGSLIGVALGVSGAYCITAVIRKLTNATALRASFSWSTLLVAAVAAMAIGLIFGTWPARRAARLTPIDAIRHE